MLPRRGDDDALGRSMLGSFGPHAPLERAVVGLARPLRRGFVGGRLTVLVGFGGNKQRINAL